MRLVVALTAGGCGSSGGGGSGGAPIAMEDVIPTLIDNSCTRLAACGQVPDKATCVAATAINLDELFASVRAGTTTYDGAAAGKCLTATRQGLAAVACSGHARVTPCGPNPSCAGMFKGTLAEGAACSRAEQCLSASCSISTCDGTPQCCVGTCAAAPTPVPIGGDCERIRLPVCRGLALPIDDPRLRRRARYRPALRRQHGRVLRARPRLCLGCLRQASGRRRGVQLRVRRYPRLLRPGDVEVRAQDRLGGPVLAVGSRRQLCRLRVL